MPALSFRASVVACALLATAMVATAADEASLDQKAWNAVWERLNTYVPTSTPYESIRVLKIVEPTTWAGGGLSGQRQLERIAGSIPANTFSVSPGGVNALLHQQYAAILLDISIPGQDAETARKLAIAQKDWGAAYRDYQSVNKEFNKLLDEHQDRMKKIGEPLTAADTIAFEQSNGGMFIEVDGRLQEAANRIQKYSPTSEHYAAAIMSLREAIAGTSHAAEFHGSFSYDGSTAALLSIEDCPSDDSKGWEALKFTQSTESTSIHSSSWNASGAWSGSFFSAGLGGDRGDYNKVIRTANDSIELRFCNARYVPLRPGTWFDISVLQAIDRGELTFKKGSPFLQAKKKVLGPNGLIPNLVTGIIVARQLEFRATLGTDSLNEVKRSSNGSGGFRAGPLRIGGGAGSNVFTQERNTVSGEYVRSTSSATPLIIAVIAEPT